MSDIIWKSLVDDDIIIGRDASRVSFKLERWEKECFFSHHIPVLTSSQIEEISVNQLKYSSPLFDIVFDKKEAHIAYSETPDGFKHQYPRNENGGMEVSIILKVKPAGNSWAFPIEDSGNLDYFYQPALTQDEIGKGFWRPEDVIGSYAVYHKTKGMMNRIGDKDYRTGKAFHIYRPKVEDSDNNSVWAELNISNGILTITVPKSFLDSAVYPVTIDPNFGYETIGGSTVSINDQIIGSPYTCPVIGLAKSITAYVDLNGNVVRNVVCNLYDDDATNPKAGTQEINPPRGVPGWYESSFASPPILAAQDYIIVAWGEVNNQYANIYYDTGVAWPDVILDPETYGGAWPDPATTDTIDARTSIYCTYSPLIGLSGSISAQAIFTGSLTVTSGALQLLAGTIAATGSLSSVLSVLKRIDGEIAANATLSADIKAFRGLAGEIAANATLVGDISTGALIALAGIISSTATLEGTLKAGRGLAGDIISSAILSADLKAARGLIGEVDAAAILSGDLKRTRGLEGEISAQATLSGILDIAGLVLLAGTIAATGTLSGAVKVLRGLAGEIDANAVFTALLELGGLVVLQGTISATGLLTGDLKAIRGLAGEIDSSASLEAVLSAAKKISGVINANAALSGTLKPFRGLTGEISAQSAFTGLLTVLAAAIELAGEISATSTMSADLKAFRGLLGTIDADGVFSGDLKAFRGLDGEIISAATLEAGIRKMAGLSGEIDAQAVFTGILNLLGVAITTIVMEGWLEKYPEIEAVFDKTLLWKAFLNRYGAIEGKLKDD